MSRDLGDRRACLATELVGIRWHRYESVDSTNLEALRLAELGAPVGTVVVADTQTAGRGRLGRSWADVPGRSLLMSVLLQRPRDGAGLLTATAALAAAEAVEALTGLRVGVKWPNDLVAAGRKLGGVLAEGRGVLPVAVGIGVNVGETVEELPPDLRNRATSVARAAGCMVGVSALAEELAGRLDRGYHLLQAGGASALVARLTARDCLAGRAVLVRIGDRTVRGEARGWQEDGRLAIRGDDGAEVLLDAGEVTLL